MSIWSPQNLVPGLWVSEENVPTGSSVASLAQVEFTPVPTLATPQSGGWADISSEPLRVLDSDRCRLSFQLPIGSALPFLSCHSFRKDLSHRPRRGLPISPRQEGGREHCGSFPLALQECQGVEL